jgi:hypothetical protein
VAALLARCLDEWRQHEELRLHARLDLREVERIAAVAKPPGGGIVGTRSFLRCSRCQATPAWPRATDVDICREGTVDPGPNAEKSGGAARMAVGSHGGSRIRRSGR